MSPQEKAKELVTMFSSKLPWYSQKDNLNKSKQCALIAVDEMLNLVCAMDGKEWWQEYCEQIKEEIENL